MSRRLTSALMQYGSALIVTGLAVGLRLLLDPLLGDRLPFITLFAAVAFAAWLGGRGPALLALVAGAFAAAFFLLEPRYSFAVDESEYQFGLVLYLILGCGTVALFESLRSKQRRLQEEVTARRAAEQRLAEREEVLRITLDCIGDAVITTDRGGNVTYMNTLAHELTGWIPGEAEGKPLSEVCQLVHEESRQPVENPVEKALRQGLTVGLSNRTLLIARDGTERPIEISAAPIRSRDGSIAGVLLAFRDCAERRRAEMADQRNKEILKLVHQIGKIGHWEWNSLTDENLWSPEIEALYGLPPGGFEGGYSGWARLVHPDDLTQAEADVRRALETGEYFTEFRVVWPDGSVHWLETRASVFKDGHDKPVRIVGVNMDITERKKQEEALRASEHRFRTMAEMLPNLVWTDLPNGQCDWLSTQWGRYTGIPEQELLGLQWVDKVLHPDDRDRTLTCWMKACADEGDYDIEYRIRRHDGEYHWFKTRGTPVRDAEGKIVYWFGTCTDIEDNKRLEEQLRRQQAVLKMAEAAARIGHFEWDIPNDNSRWSPELEALFGLPPGEFENSSAGWRKSIHPDDLATVEAAVRESLSTGRLQAEFRAVLPDGTIRWLEARAVVFPDDTGRPLRMVGINMDVTERKRFETLLRESEERLRLTLEAGSMGTFEVDVETGEGVWNTVQFELLGLKAGDAVPGPTTFFRFVHPDDAERLSGEWDAATRTGKFDTEFRIVRADGEVRWLAGRGSFISALPITETKPGARNAVRFLGVNFDITERKVAEASLRESDRRKDEFLATLAHELRNPLAPIRNALQILRLAGGNPDAVAQCRAMMERQLSQMVRLVDDLLDVSRISSGKLELRKEQVRLLEVLNSAVETSRPLIEQMGHELTVELPEQSIVVDVDPTRLAQAFLNLLNNAAKYSDRGGRIRLTAERQGNDVVVSVKDTGIGISADQLPRLFTMFSQAKAALERSQGGLGVGLTLVKRLVEMHGGSIEARSDGPGTGSEFVVRLPVVAEESISQQDEGSTDGEFKSALRILVVDDNRDGADSLAMMLKMMGNEAMTAYDGEEAVAAALEFQPDVILLDIGLPKLTGYDVCRRVRAQPGGEELVVIAQTGWGQEDDRQRSQQAGFNHHMVKPVDPLDLMKLLTGLQPVSQRPANHIFGRPVIGRPERERGVVHPESS